MGKVTDFVVGLVRKRLGESGPIVWFDPDRTYESVLPCLDDVPVFRYTDSFLRLRHDVDSHMNGWDPPGIVVYVPMEERDTHDALVELTAAGITLRPGHASRSCNTRLSVVAREALKGSVPDAALDEILKKVEAGQLTLHDLDGLAERGAPDLSVLFLIFGTTQPDEIVLTFLSDTSKDADLVGRGGVADLKRFVAEEYGADTGENESIEPIRSKLAIYLLGTDCLLSTKGAPASLGAAKLPESEAQKVAVSRLASIWRNRVDLVESYMEHAALAEAVVDLSKLPSDVDALDQTETFAANDETIQRLVATSVREKAEPRVVELARRRQTTFWGRQPMSNARWQLIATAGDLLLECACVRSELGNVTDATEMVSRYTEGDRPWCDMDTSQRRLERLYLEFDVIAAYPDIEKLVAKARATYQDAGNALCDGFVNALERTKFKLRSLRQRDTYAQLVDPDLSEGPTAYFMVDAMRFEMGRELGRLLAGEGEIAISGAIASVPTITEIGMASLLPGAEGSVEVVDVGGGKLALKIGETLLRNRAERMAFLGQNSHVPTAVLKLEDFQPLKKATREAIKGARLIVVTSQEIDMVGEADNTAFARQTMGQALEMILRAVRALNREGIERFVITADHGYLFGEETLSDMLLDRPGGGQDADLHRRVWVGRGGGVVPNTVRFKASAFGMGGDLDIVSPRTLACFKAGGGNSFFHGGVSLQELIVPVVTVKARAKAAPAAGIKWMLGGPKRVTTRVYSVSISAETMGLFDIDAPRVRVELRTGGKKIGRLQSADYGVEPEAEEIALRRGSDGRSIEENHVTFVLDDLDDASELEVRLIDARSEAVLDKMEHIEVAISL